MTIGYRCSHWWVFFLYSLYGKNLRAKSAFSPDGKGSEHIRGGSGEPPSRWPPRRHRGAERYGNREGRASPTRRGSTGERDGQLLPLGDAFLEHRLGARALGPMARRSIGSQQASLTNHAQKVLGYSPQRNNTISIASLSKESTHTKTAIKLQISYQQITILEKVTNSSCESLGRFPALFRISQHSRLSDYKNVFASVNLILRNSEFWLLVLTIDRNYSMFLNFYGRRIPL